MQFDGAPFTGLEPEFPAIGLNGSALSGIAYGNGRYVAVGYYVGDDTGLIQTSEDGMNWTLVSSQTVSILDLYNVTFANSIFVAVGWDFYTGGNIYHSTNGINWTPHNTAIANIYALTFGAGLFVAGGDGVLLNSSARTNRNIYTSPDGIAWTARVSGAPANDVQTISDVAYGAGRFVAVDGATHLYRSTTGSSTWTRTTNSSAGGWISFCNGLFIVPSGPGTNLISTDGLSWTLITNNTASTFGRVIYSDGYDVALAGAKIFTSTDGTNWVQRNLQPLSNVALNGIASGNRNFLAVGYRYPPFPYRPVAYISDPLVALGMNRGFPPQLSLSGLLGRSYRIEQLGYLRSNNWQSAATFTLTNSPSTWTDTAAPNSARFYRAVLLP
jgi:hypothetical protein